MLTLILLSSSFLRADEPQWIWSSATAATRAPQAKAHFRMTFDLETPESGRVEITADDSYTLFANGRKVGAGNTWEQLDAHDIKAYLKKGRNVLAVTAENLKEGPAGLVARVTLKARESAARELSTNKDWRVSQKEFDGWMKEDFDDSGWDEASPLGTLGKTGPWGDKVAAAPGPEAPPQFEAVARPDGPFQLLDGDRVVFIGDALVERAQNSDYIEASLTSRFAARRVIFRNLGWSGDTVFGEARAGFGTAPDGFDQLKQQVFTLRPTVIFVAYGGSSSFDGLSGLSQFEQGYHTLLDLLETTKAEIILVSPIRHEDLGRPFPDPRAHNESLELYAKAVAGIARRRHHRFVDLLHELSPRTSPDPRERLTENGIHLSDLGYWRAARSIARQLELAEQSWELSVDASGKIVRAEGTTPTAVKASSSAIRFDLLDERLPEAAPQAAAEGGRTLKFERLAAGRYTLRIDDHEVATADAREWEAGQRIRTGPEFEQAELLRRTIMAKNRLYFYRWRPQNETYLFGFRKHEQGSNAREIPMFDPLVSEQEAKIAELRVPVKHTYELVKQK